MWIGIYLVICVVVAVFSSFPYLAYSFGLPEAIWLLVCVLREIIYFFIFFAHWASLLLTIRRENDGMRCVTRCNFSFAARKILAVTFAGTYTFLYGAKWFTVHNIILQEVSMALFTLSWFHVFYCMIDKQLNTDVDDEEIRGNLLRRIRTLEREVSRNPMRSAEVLAMMDTEDNIEMLLEFEPGTDEYRCGASGTDCFLGICLLPLAASLMEDYGYSIAMLLKLGNETIPLPISETDFLWLMTCLSLCFAMMYLIAVRRIPRRWNGECNWTGITCSLVISFCAGVLASIRLDASYAIFGRITARLLVPEPLAATVIWLGTILVFGIDFLASAKIISSTRKKMMTLLAHGAERFLGTGGEKDWIIRWFGIYLIKHRTKHLKRVIRTTDVVTLEQHLTAC